MLIEHLVDVGAEESLGIGDLDAFCRGVHELKADEASRERAAPASCC